MNLENFISNWEKDYTSQVSTLPLFTRKIPSEKIELFVKLLYHIRGHFSEFLWHLGSYAPNKDYKDIILKNISDEFGAELDSHEHLYIDFSQALNINLGDEIVTHEYNLEFIQSFNRGHILWLIERKNSWNHQWAAFSAYEKLDNVDYENLYNLAKRLNVSEDGLVFFDIHRNGDHYSPVFVLLQELWDKDSSAIKDGFKFIGEHQLEVWTKLSELIFSN